MNTINRPTPIRVLTPITVTPRQRSATTFSDLRLNCVMCTGFLTQLSGPVHTTREMVNRFFLNI